ncbi:MAG: glycosyltransferase family A protein [Nitrososphaeria archaeon]
MGEPLISVIITAYNRKEFLPQAVSSALRQTLPREFYEVIVVKNFEDEEIDSWLEESGVRSILSEAPEQGEHLAAALEEAKGEVLSFLDDDDMFSDKKLEAVRSAFRREEVVFHRNRRTLIDAKGRRIGEEAAHPASQARGSNPGTLGKLMGLGMHVNSSSMSIRRSALDAIGVERFRRVRLAVDSLYFVAALLQGGILVYDPHPLTLYRIHSEQSYIDTRSLYTYVKKRCESAKGYASDYEELMKIVGGTPYEVAVKPLLIRSRVVSAVFCPSENGPTTRELAYLIKHSKNIGMGNKDLLLLLGFVAACMLPPLRSMARRTEYELNKAIRRGEAPFGKTTGGSPINL